MCGHSVICVAGECEDRLKRARLTRSADGNSAHASASFTKRTKIPDSLSSARRKLLQRARSKDVLVTRPAKCGIQGRAPRLAASPKRDRGVEVTVETRRPSIHCQ